MMNEQDKKEDAKYLVDGKYYTAFADHIAISKILYPSLSECFMQMSVYQLDFPDNFFDCVSLQEVIEHLEKPTEAIREINRVLKTEGILILSTNNALYFRNIIGTVRKSVKRLIGKKVTLSPVIYFDNVEWNRHIFCWTPETLYTLFKTNGFEYLDYRIVGGSGRIDKLLQKFFPELCSTQILKVQKVSESPRRYL